MKKLVILNSILLLVTIFFLLYCNFKTINNGHWDSTIDLWEWVEVTGSSSLSYLLYPIYWVLVPTDSSSGNWGMILQVIFMVFWARKNYLSTFEEKNKEVVYNKDEILKSSACSFIFFFFLLFTFFSMSYNHFCQLWWR